MSYVVVGTNHKGENIKHGIFCLFCYAEEKARELVNTLNNVVIYEYDNTASARSIEDNSANPINEYPQVKMEVHND